MVQEVWILGSITEVLTNKEGEHNNHTTINQTDMIYSGNFATRHSRQFSFLHHQMTSDLKGDCLFCLPFCTQDCVCHKLFGQ